MEQVSPETADDFVRKIYDWNPYAAAYAIGDVEAPGSARVSSEMKLVMAAMLAERLWDIIEATVQRSRDAIGVLGTNEARRQ